MNYLKYIRDLCSKIVDGETVLLDNTMENKVIYNVVCDMLQEDNVDFVSGDIDPLYPEEQYYIELN